MPASRRCVRCDVRGFGHDLPVDAGERHLEPAVEHAAAQRHASRSRDRHVVDGFNHGGVFVPFHRNQTVLVYVEDHFPDGNVPDTAAELLDWAKANPGHLAVTSPARGGSGDGFMQSLMMELITDPACTEALGNYQIDAEAAKAYVESDCAAPVWNYYKELVPLVEVTAGNSDTLNLITNGVAWIGTGWEDMAFDFVNRGLLPPTTRLTLMEHGQVGGGDGYFVPTRAPHRCRAPADGLLRQRRDADREALAQRLAHRQYRCRVRGPDRCGQGSTCCPTRSGRAPQVEPATADRRGRQGLPDNILRN